MPTWESAFNYSMMHVVAEAMILAGSVSDPRAIRGAVARALPILYDKYPNELFRIQENGVLDSGGGIQSVENGKFGKVYYILSFPKSPAEFERFKKISKTRDPENCLWIPVP